MDALLVSTYMGSSKASFKGSFEGVHLRVPFRVSLGIL